MGDVVETLWNILMRNWS